MDTSEIDVWLSLSIKQLLHITNPQVRSLVNTIKNNQNSNKVKQAKEQLIELLTTIYS